MHNLGVSKVRSSLAAILRRIGDDKQPIIIERRGKTLAALVSVEDLMLIETCRGNSRSANKAALMRTRTQGKIGTWCRNLMGSRSTSYSEECARLHGVTPEELPALMEDKIERVVHPDDRGRVRAATARFHDGNADYEIDYRIVRPNRETRHILEIGETVYDETGRTTAQTGIFQDITEGYHAVEALRESEKRFRDFAESASGCFWETGPDFRIQWVFGKCECLGGPAVGDDPASGCSSIIGKTCCDLTSEDVENEKWQVHRADLIAHRPIRDFRFQVKSSEGAIGHLTVNAVPVFGTEDRFQGYRGMLSDVSRLVEAEQALKCVYGGLEERVRERTTALHETNKMLRKEIAERELAQQALRASEAQLKAFIDHSPAEIGIKDADGRYVLVNRIMEELIGVSLEDIKAKSPHQVFEKEVADQVAAHDREVLRSGAPVEREIDGYWNGRHHKFQSIKFPIRDELNRIVGIGAIATDVTEQRRAQQALKESEERFRDMAANVPGIVYQFTADGDGNKSFPFVSSRIEQIFGVKAEDAMKGGNFWSASVHADDRARLEASTAESLRTLNPWQWEGRMYCRSGELGWFRGYSTPRQLEDGTVLWNGILVDVTASKQAEELLRESEARLAGAMRQTRLAHWNYRFREKEITGWSAQAVDILGVAAENLPTRFEECLAFVDPADRERVAKTFQIGDCAKPEFKPYQIEYRFIRPDGQPIWLKEVTDLDIDVTGEPIGYLGTIQDITAMKQAEEAVRTRDIWLRAILENSPIHIALKDTERRFMAVSSNILKYLGLSADRCVGHKIEEFLPESIAGAYIAADREVVETGLPIQQEIVEDWSGSPQHFLSAKFPLKDDEGQILGVCSLTSDITEVKQAEERLRQAQKMEAVGQLTGGVAHDFNNLLAIIQGNIELLVEKSVGEDPRMQAILRASARGAELTQRLLAFSRRQSLRPQSIDLAALVRGMSDLLRRTLGATIDIEMTMEPGLWHAVADPGQVENALLNLAINARDAMRDGGKLTVGCFNARVDETNAAQNADVSAGDYVVLVAIDSGLGMSSEVLQHVFEPFFTTKKVGEGSGLGLSMVYGFAKQSGGHVTIHSEKTRGTTVKLYLPRAQQAPGPMVERALDDLPRGQGEVLLVIEDDPDVRELTVSMLDGLDYQVIDVPEAASAWAVLGRGEKVDLVISDIVLPGDQSGLEFAEEARERYPDIKIIFMSGFPAEAETRDRLAGLDRVVLNKPFRLRQLARVLRTELDRNN